MTQSMMDRLLTAGLCGNTLGQDIQTLTQGRRKGGGGVRTILRAHDGRGPPRGRNVISTEENARVLHFSPTGLRSANFHIII